MKGTTVYSMGVEAFNTPGCLSDANFFQRPYFLKGMKFGLIPPLEGVIKKKTSSQKLNVSI